MQFNSTEFLVFLAAFTLLYGLARGNLRQRNLLIVAASYLFYGWWNWKLLGLLALSSVVDFRVGLALGDARSESRRRFWLGVSLAFNLGLLGLFKYLGFFLESFYLLLDSLGVQHPSWTWNILLPVGISFYTFQSLGYTIDVYRRQIEPSRDLPAYLAFVSFFPQLVAGPIERASHLLPQFHQTRVIHLADVESGVWLALWGLFKKVVIADQLAPFTELAFDHDVRSAPVLLLGTLAFAGQIYGDFSGYSDVARGIARCLGFDLMRNFDRPYAAPNLREFWRRWHISLSTWMRDYLYVPLGGNRGSEARVGTNLILTFLVAGLWHGAAWNFVLWGAWHGLALVAQRQWSLRTGKRPNSRQSSSTPKPPGSESRQTVLPLPPAGEGRGEGVPSITSSGSSSLAVVLKPLSWLLTLLTVGYGWLLFRANTPGSLVRLHETLLHWTAPPWFPDYLLGVVAWCIPLFAVEFWSDRRCGPLTLQRLPPVSRALLFGTLTLLVAAYWEREAVPFLYFQF